MISNPPGRLAGDFLAGTPSGRLSCRDAWRETFLPGRLAGDFLAGTPSGRLSPAWQARLPFPPGVPLPSGLQPLRSHRHCWRR